MLASRAQVDELPVINMTPMVDVILCLLVFFMAATRLYDFGQPIPLDLFFRIAVNGGLVAGAAGSIALLAAGALAGRTQALGVTVAFLVLDYAAWIVAQWWPRLSFLKPATLFYYSSSVKLGHGWPLGDMGVLLFVILAAATIGGIAWQRRDLSF